MFTIGSSGLEPFVIVSKRRQIGPFDVDVEIPIENVPELDVGQSEVVTDEEQLIRKPAFSNGQLLLQCGDSRLNDRVISLLLRRTNHGPKKLGR